MLLIVRADATNWFHVMNLEKPLTMAMQKDDEAGTFTLNFDILVL